MDCVIRKAETRDIPALLEMNAVFNKAGRGCTAEYMEYALKHYHNEIVLVAVCENTPAGFICGQVYPSICYAEGLQCEVAELFVRKEYRKKGIASQLISSMENEFLSRNAQEILLQTGKDNEIARKFYEHNGYLNTGRIVYRKRYGVLADIE